MKKDKISRTQLLQVRLTPKELENIQNKFSKSTDRKLSEYIRKILLDKPVTINRRNQSFDDFMAEMIALRRELNTTANNFNQVVKRLHSLEETPELKTWLLLNISICRILQEKIGEIKIKINQISDQWLQ